MSGLASHANTPATVSGRANPWPFFLAAVLCPAGLVLALGLRLLWAWRRPPWWLPLLLAAGTVALVHTAWLGPRGLTWGDVLGQYAAAHRVALGEVAARLSGRGAQAGVVAVDTAAPVLEQVADTVGERLAETRPEPAPGAPPAPTLPASPLPRLRLALVTVAERAATLQTAATAAPDTSGPTLGYLRATWPLWLPVGLLAAAWHALRSSWAAWRARSAGGDVPGSPGSRVPGAAPRGAAPGNGNGGNGGNGRSGGARGSLGAGQGGGTAGEPVARLVPVHQRPRRALVPPVPVVAGVVPAGHVSLVYGDAGLGKSTVTLDVALHVVAGLPWHGRAVRRMPALFVDAELDEPTFRQRAGELAAGLGLPDGRPPKGLYYLHLEDPLSDLRTIATVARAVRRCLPWWQRVLPAWWPAAWGGDRSVLVCYDSLTIGGGLGVSAGDAAVTAALKAMRRAWLLPGGRGAIVAVDHVPKLPAGSRADPRQQLPFASAAKKFHTRSMVVVVPPTAEARRRGVTVELSHHKHNFGPLFGSLLLAAQRDTGTLRYRLVEEIAPPSPQFQPVAAPEDVDAAEAEDVPDVPDVPDVATEPDADQSAGTAASAPTSLALERVVLALRRCGQAGATREELATLLSASAKTASNRLSELRAAGRVCSVAGRWYVPEYAPASPSAVDPEDTQDDPADVADVRETREAVPV